MTNIQTISVEYASQDKAGEIEIRKNSIGGPILGKATFEATGGWGKMKWTEAKLDKPEDGFADLYFLAIKRTKPADNLIKFKTLSFK